VNHVLPTREKAAFATTRIVQLIADTKNQEGSHELGSDLGSGLDFVDDLAADGRNGRVPRECSRREARATQMKMTWPLRADATVQRSYFMHGRTALSFTRIEPQE
jgi:hypothetical protein